MSEDLQAILALIDGIPWHDRWDAYGSATETPRFFRQMIYGDEDDRLDAINDLLWSRAYHQFDVYSVTPDVMRVVLALARVPVIASARSFMERTVLEEFVHFIRVCVDGSRVRGDCPELESKIAIAARSGMDFYRTLTSHQDKRIVQDARWLLQFCSMP